MVGVQGAGQQRAAVALKGKKSKSKSALLSMLQHVQDIQRIEITSLSDPRCNNEHLPYINPKNTVLYIL